MEVHLEEAEQPQEKINWLRRFGGILISPRATLEEVAKRPDWVIPCIFLLIWPVFLALIYTPSLTGSMIFGLGRKPGNHGWPLGRRIRCHLVSWANTWRRNAVLSRFQCAGICVLSLVCEWTTWDYPEAIQCTVSGLYESLFSVEQNGDIENTIWKQPHMDQNLERNCRQHWHIQPLVILSGLSGRSFGVWVWSSEGCGFHLFILDSPRCFLHHSDFAYALTFRHWEVL